MLLCTAAALAGCSGTAPAAQEKFTDYVNTRIGTGGHGHVFVGANVPFGFVQLGHTFIPPECEWLS